ncbi:unnamed protein product [Boreogadus saida]
MDDERLVVEVEKYVELYDQSSRHYKDNSKKVIAWRAIALEIGSSVPAPVRNYPKGKGSARTQKARPRAAVLVPQRHFGER